MAFWGVEEIQNIARKRLRQDKRFLVPSSKVPGSASLLTMVELAAGAWHGHPSVVLEKRPCQYGSHKLGKGQLSERTGMLSKKWPNSTGCLAQAPHKIQDSAWSLSKTLNVCSTFLSIE
jgi:hypothetical protein